MKLSLALAVALLGCGRAHLEPGFGRSFHAQFALQQQPTAKPVHAATGLDAQEASILARTYRRGLAPKEEEEKEQPILVVTPSPQGPGRVMPMPSVPGKE
ncbi:MAG TPA: hypothetical protein VFG59_09705 [Anaeromyxobacter sp.]|nr:hypothetical protein [Anaeromyxobacter sp.]